MSENKEATRRERRGNIFNLCNRICSLSDNTDTRWERFFLSSSSFSSKTFHFSLKRNVLKRQIMSKPIYHSCDRVSRFVFTLNCFARSGWVCGELLDWNMACVTSRWHDLISPSTAFTFTFCAKKWGWSLICKQMNFTFIQIVHGSEFRMYLIVGSRKLSS